jgi:hypothetical protein
MDDDDNPYLRDGGGLADEWQDGREHNLLDRRALMEIKRALI